MLYFAYGSNMSTPRLKARIPSANLIGTGCLQGYQLVFHKVSMRDGSGKCDASYTSNRSDQVFGVLYDFPSTDLVALDKIEGVGQGYDVKILDVQYEQKLVMAQTYLATNTDAGLKPLLWYKEHVLRGASEHDLPEEYIQYINSVEAIVDLDSGRAARELSLYR